MKVALKMAKEGARALKNQALEIVLLILAVPALISYLQSLGNFLSIAQRGIGGYVIGLVLFSVTYPISIGLFVLWPVLVVKLLKRATPEPLLLTAIGVLLFLHYIGIYVFGRIYLWDPLN